MGRAGEYGKHGTRERPGSYSPIVMTAHPLLPASPARALPALLLAAALPGASGCSAPFSWEEKVETTEVFTEDFLPGERFDLRNVNGQITVAAWERHEAEITARKVGPSEEALAETEVVIQRTSEGLRVRTRYPRRKWGRYHGSVHYRVRLPSEAVLRLETVNGPVEVEDVSGSVDAQTVNGVLRLVRQRGRVNAQTVNGPIECELEAMAAGERHSFRTVNGKVNLALAPGVEGTVDARAVNGRVVVELDDEVTNLATPTRRRKTLQVGSGGGECRVRTVNGAIHVTRLAD